MNEGILHTIARVAMMLAGALAALEFTSFVGRATHRDNGAGADPAIASDEAKKA